MNFSNSMEKGYLAPEMMLNNEITPEQGDKARKTVCHFAADADEALYFMKMLGLT